MGTMKNYSYLYLFTISIAVMLVIFGFIIWHSGIYAETFLNDATSKNFILVTLGLSICLSLYAFQRGVIKTGKRIDYLKFFMGTFIVLMAVAVIPLMTVAYYLPGKTSAYAAGYTYSPRGHKSCAGANVDDPDLGRNIKICNPEGNFQFDKDIFISKKTNALGTVILFAMTAP